MSLDLDAIRDRDLKAITAMLIITPETYVATMEQVRQSRADVTPLRNEVARLRAEVDRLTEHSTWLNTVGFKLAEALGDVPPGADAVEGNPIEQAERLIAERDRLAAKVDRWRVELRDKGNDLLDVRGILSPNGYDPVTPLSLVPTVAPAVQWLVDELTRLRAELVEMSAASAYRVEVLQRIADRAHAIGQPAVSIVTLTERGLALEAWDDSVPPGGMVCALCGMPVESEPCPLHGPRDADADAEQLAAEDTAGMQPCQPIGCDHGYHLAGCQFADIDATDSGTEAGQ